MATRPMDFLSGLGGLANIPNPARDFDAGLAADQALRTTRLQQDAAQLQVSNALARRQRENAFHSDIVTLGDDPTPTGIAALIRKYPEFAEQLKASHDIQDEAKRLSDYRLQSQIYAAASQGRYDLASNLLKAHRDASAKAGEAPDPVDGAIIDALESGDPIEQKRALSMIGLSVAALDPKKFAETYKALLPQDRNVVVSAGSAIVDPETGREIYRAPDKPEYRSLGAGETLVEVGGASGGPPAGNSPEAALGTGADLDRRVSGIFPGLVATSGKRTPERNAAVGGVPNSFHLTDQARDYPAAPGLTLAQTAQRLRASLPAGYQVIAESDHVHVEPASRGRSQGGARVVAQGADKPGYRILSPAENAQFGLDPALKYQQSPDGQITLLGGQDSRTRLGRAIPLAAVEKIGERVAIRDNLGRALATFQDNFAGNTVVGEAENWAQALLGTGTPGQRDWWANFRDTDNLIRNQLFGSALTEHEKKAYEATTISPKMAPTIVRQNLTRRNDIIRKALDRQKRVMLANKYEAEAIEELFSGDPLAGGAPVQVKTVAEAMKLAPGTLYMRPDGQVMRR